MSKQNKFQEGHSSSQRFTVDSMEMFNLSSGNESATCLQNN